jgi:energy-coupling factor transporter transmembrane protein EcfT
MNGWSNKVTWGVILVFFGFLFFIKKTGIIPVSWNEIFNVQNFPVYAGIIFLIGRNIKVAVALFVLALLLRFGQIIELTRGLSHYLWPLLLIIAGLILILNKKVWRK